ncbi:hypothetical protein CKA34_02715 [Rhizobium sp. 11515TR]|nr:hypothetical protein CKA34_02715 [Rhizobium sp. 11515TR]
MPMPPSDKKAASAARHDCTPRLYISKQLPNRSNFLFNEYVRVFRLSNAVTMSQGGISAARFQNDPVFNAIPRSG